VAGAVGTEAAMPRRGTLEDSSESSLDLAAIDVEVSDNTVESPKVPMSSDDDGGAGARPIVARPRFQYYPFTRPQDIESGRGGVSTDDGERAHGSTSKAKPAGTDSAASEEAPRVTAYEVSAGAVGWHCIALGLSADDATFVCVSLLQKHLVWARSTDKAACVFFQGMPGRSFFFHSFLSLS
jgi:hypothetical protein